MLCSKDWFIKFYFDFKLDNFRQYYCYQPNKMTLGLNRFCFTDCCVCFIAIDSSRSGFIIPISRSAVARRLLSFAVGVSCPRQSVAVEPLLWSEVLALGLLVDYLHPICFHDLQFRSPYFQSHHYLLTQLFVSTANSTQSSEAVTYLRQLAPSEPEAIRYHHWTSDP